MPVGTATDPTKVPRVCGWDALRGGLMLLGIVLHGAMFYMAAPPPTMLRMGDSNTSYVFDLLFGFIHIFRMPAFFVLSGFLAALSVEERGWTRFLLGRAKRVLLPLLLALVTFLPLTVWVLLNVMVSARFGTRDFLPERSQLITLAEEIQAAGYPVGEPQVGHLWFLFFLCYFYLAMPVGVWVVRLGRPLELPLKRALASPLIVTVLGGLTAATLWPFRGAEVIEGVVRLKPHVPALIYYGAFFFSGCLFHHHREILSRLSRLAWWHAAAAVTLFPLAHLASRAEYAAPGPVAGLHLAAAIFNGLCTWASIFALIGFALRTFTGESPKLRYLARSAYWIYLVHIFVIGAAVWLLLPYPLPAVVKFSGVVSVTTLLCFLSYHYVVQGSWIGALLNSRRDRQRWPWGWAAAADRERAA